jgi:hypothetical protein
MALEAQWVFAIKVLGLLVAASALALAIADTDGARRE